MPKTVIDAERDYVAALEHLLRCAMAVGLKQPGAIVKAKRARQTYNAAVKELRTAERHRGRVGSINWVRSQMGVSKHSGAVRGQSDNADYREAVERALTELEKATW